MLPSRAGAPAACGINLGRVAQTPEIGQVAPDFTLPGIQLTGSEVSQSEYTLSQHRGQPLVLAFYPGDFTPG